MNMPNITPDMYRRVCPYKTRDDDGCTYPQCPEDCEGRRQFVTTFRGAGPDGLPTIAQVDALSDEDLIRGLLQSTTVLNKARRVISAVANIPGMGPVERRRMEFKAALLVHGLLAGTIVWDEGAMLGDMLMKGRRR